MYGILSHKGRGIIFSPRIWMSIINESRSLELIIDIQIRWEKSSRELYGLNIPNNQSILYLFHGPDAVNPSMLSILSI